MSKNILITGASRGIGARCAQNFAKEGCRVTLCGRTFSQKAEETLKKVREYDKSAAFLPFDVRVAEESEKAVALALSNMGGIDTLVLCAGVAKQELFQYTDEKTYDYIMDTNVKGAYLVTKAVLPHMISQKSGSIIFISSMWGEVGASMEVIYSASKAALIGMTKALAKEVAPSGIRVNCVSPGVIATDMTLNLGKETLNALAKETPLGRNGTPEDIAQAVYFLSSEAASFITGQNIGVNGGFVI